jgi:hypothetical protein
MTDICELHEVGWRLFISYMSKVGDYLSVTLGSLTVISQIHEAG